MENQVPASPPGSGHAQPGPFSQLVRKIVIHEHRGVLRDLAASIGLSYGALYNRLNGRAEFNPREINILLRELADPRLTECLLAGTGFHATRTSSGSPAPAGEDLLKSALTVAVETLSAVRAAIEVSRHGILARGYHAEIDRMFTLAQRELVALREALATANGYVPGANQTDEDPCETDPAEIEPDQTRTGPVGASWTGADQTGIEPRRPAQGQADEAPLLTTQRTALAAVSARDPRPPKTD